MGGLCTLTSTLLCIQMLAPHTSPLFVSAWRLLPAGLVLIAWASLKGRPAPKTAMAWVSIAAFALVDATCFQVSCDRCGKHRRHSHWSKDQDLASLLCQHLSVRSQKQPERPATLVRNNKK